MDIQALVTEMVKLSAESLQDEEGSANFEKEFTEITSGINEAELELLLVSISERGDIDEAEKLFLIRKLIMLANVSREKKEEE